MNECIPDLQISVQNYSLYDEPQYKSAPQQNNNRFSWEKK